MFPNRKFKTMGIKNQAKKTKLASEGRKTKWAPVWAVLKRFGVGKKIHPSTMTRKKRSWRRTKLHIKPGKRRKSHLG